MSNFSPPQAQSAFAGFDDAPRAPNSIGCLSLRTVIAVGMLFPACVLSVAIGFAQLKGISVANLTRDPAAVLGGPAYIGFASHIGVILWIAAGAAALVGGYFASALKATNGRLLCWAGVLSLALGADDLLMLHEDIFPRIGLPQKLILSIYAGFALLFVMQFWREILERAYPLIALAALFLGTSLVVDMAVSYSEFEAALEDGAKLFGVTFWLLFVVSEVSAAAGAA